MEVELRQLLQQLDRYEWLVERYPSLWPVRGRITSRFGYRVHPIRRRRLFHSGIDIAVSPGTSVKAAACGRVVYAGWRSGYGKTIIIDHGQGIRTLYAHNSRLHVKVGQWVNKGQVICASGNTGTSTGPHLHFEVLLNGQPKNPLDYLS
ncbi:MAG: M23 family metallopeptidase [Firmicutes bacterium]|nr:M23 family metallopeptidase [Bacillota bacterium]